MIADDLRRRIAAPELLVVDVAEAALVALLRALGAQHPTLGDPDHDDPPSLRRAHTVHRTAQRLRRELRRYTLAVDDALFLSHDHDLPF